MPLPISSAISALVPISTGRLATSESNPAPSAFARMIPCNAPALPPVATPVHATISEPQPSMSLMELRRRCASEGIPAVVEDCLRVTLVKDGLGVAAPLPPRTRAVLLQQLFLSLADDRTKGSPIGVDPRADACRSYQLDQTELPPIGPRPRGDDCRAYQAGQEIPPNFLPYHKALLDLSTALATHKDVLPGTYGFLQQSARCKDKLESAETAEDVRSALSGWMNWQWSALPAFDVDPLMRARSGDGALAAVSVAYGLDNNTRDGANILAALHSQLRSG